MAYAIIRTEKLKTLEAIGQVARHAFRVDNVKNADADRAHLNEHHGARSTREVVNGIKARLPEKRRKDAVLAIEYLISASPEWFEREDNDVATEYFRRARAFLYEKHGNDNVVHFCILRDTETPHAFAYVVPIDERGRLSCKSFMGGREKLRALQTGFAKVVADLGLTRGVEGSRARHEHVYDIDSATKFILGTIFKTLALENRTIGEAYLNFLADQTIGNKLERRVIVAFAKEIVRAHPELEMPELAVLDSHPPTQQGEVA